MNKFDFPVVVRENFVGVHTAYYFVKKELGPFLFGDTEAYLFAYCHYDNLYNLYYRDHDEFSDPDFDFYMELYKMLMNLFKDMFLTCAAFDCFKVDFSSNPDDDHMYYFDQKGEMV